MVDLFLDRSARHTVESIINQLYPQSTVVAFGSRVTGSAHAGSDLDLAIISYGQKSGDLQQLRTAFTDSDLPFLVDISEFDSLPDYLQHDINGNHVMICNYLDRLNNQG